MQLQAAFELVAGDSFSLQWMQIDDRDPVEVPEHAREPYSHPLLLLFTNYQHWREKGEAAERFLLKGQDHSSAVKSLTELHRNSRKDNHWARSILHTPDAGALLEVPRGRAGVRFARLNGDHPTVTVLFGKRPLTDRESLDGFVRLAPQLNTPHGRQALRFGGIRENLKYSVELADRPVWPELIDRLCPPDYQFFAARIEFARLALRPLEEFVIALKEAGADLSESVSQSPRGVIYREVYSVRESDRAAFHDQMERACRAGEPAARAAELAKVMPVEATVGGLAANLIKIERLTTGYHLYFAFPRPAIDRLFHRFVLQMHGFQPRSLLSFPIVISEPTRHAELEFKYPRATIDNVGFFVGCRVGPDGERAKAELSHRNRIFSLKRDDELLTPGEGAVVFWSPVQKVDQVRLVDLAKFDNRFVIDPPYATPNNFFGQQFYPSPRLFVVEETAVKLKRVLEKCHKQGFKLKIWDAYRPPSVQRRMREVKPDTRYVADPAHGSVHNRACAVDVTLVAWDASGELALPMPTEYDDFTDNAHPATIERQDTEQANNFKRLRKLMEEEEFDVLDTEWWHFNDRDWRKYPILDLEPYERMLSGDEG
ncbi:MAG: M15 family metallopeptidase [Gemmataceae bacterium]|nr:M15 family metallopeptidase [Gemmataceae bacterium]